MNNHWKNVVSQVPFRGRGNELGQDCAGEAGSERALRANVLEQEACNGYVLASCAGKCRAGNGASLGSGGFHCAGQELPACSLEGKREGKETGKRGCFVERQGSGKNRLCKPGVLVHPVPSVKKLKNLKRSV